MTVQRTSVQLWLEQAPTDPFDDDSTPRYRVVAALGQGATRRCIVPLTRAHDSEEQAMSVLSDKILRGLDPAESRPPVYGEPQPIKPNPVRPTERGDRKRWRR